MIATGPDRASLNLEAGAQNQPGSIEVIVVDLKAITSWIFDEERETPRLPYADDERAAGRASHSQPSQSIKQDARVAARIATRITIERLLGQQFRSVAFEIASGGKPRLPNSDVEFSLSHTDGVAVIAMTHRHAIGVDVEAVRPLNISGERRARIRRSAAHWVDATATGFNPAVGAEHAEEVASLRDWTVLEAVAKAKGTGIGKVLTEYGVFGPTESDIGQSSGGDEIHSDRLDTQFGSALCDVRMIDVDAVLNAGSGVSGVAARYIAALASVGSIGPIAMTLFPRQRAGVTAFLASRGRSERALDR